MMRAGSALGSAASVMSCPCTFFSMSAWMRSRTSSRYCVGSNVSDAIWSISCFASFSSASFTSVSGISTSLIERTSPA